MTVSRTDAVTRILFEAFSKAEVRLFYLLGYAAIAVFFYGVYVQVRKYRRGAALKLEGGLWAPARRHALRRCSATAPSTAATGRPEARIG